MTSDVAIIGAGPAGAWAAYRLATAGARVTLFDHSHPREKPCGGGLSARALALVADVFTRRPLEGVAVTAARFETSAYHPRLASAWQPSVTSVVPLPGNAGPMAAPLVVASRRVFDQHLVDAAIEAGARLISCRARDVVVEPDITRIRTSAGEHRAHFLIGADGANSLVRRRLLGGFSRAQLSLATGFFAHGISSNEIVIRFVAQPPGYIWSFPRPTHLAIGICAQSDAATSSALREHVASWMTHWGGSTGSRLESYSWPIPTLPARDLDRLPVAGDRWALIGDAAGLVDPITREGIYFALRSGAIVADCLGAGAPAGHQYATTVRDEICPELMRAASLKAGFFTPLFTRLTVETLAESASVRRTLVDLVAGRRSYVGLRRRLLSDLEPGAACRLLGRQVQSLFDPPRRA